MKFRTEKLDQQAYLCTAKQELHQQASLPFYFLVDKMNQYSITMMFLLHNSIILGVSKGFYNLMLVIFSPRH